MYKSLYDINPCESSLRLRYVDEYEQYDRYVMLWMSYLSAEICCRDTVARVNTRIETRGDMLTGNYFQDFMEVN